MLDFADNFKERIITLELATESELANWKADLVRHLDNPNTSVFIGPYIQAWGRKLG
jgi:hypothetical protein